MPRFKAAKLCELTEHHARIMYDRVADDLGAPCEWLTAEDFLYRVGSRYDRAWFYARGGDTACACVMPASRSAGFPAAELVAELARQVEPAAPALGAPRWAIFHGGYATGAFPVPVLPYRYTYAILSKFGIARPDSYIASNARHLIRRERENGFVPVTCRNCSEPFTGRMLGGAVAHMLKNGLRMTAAGYGYAKLLAGSDYQELRPAVKLEDALRLCSRPCTSCNGRGMFVCHSCDDTGNVLVKDW